MERATCGGGGVRPLPTFMRHLASMLSASIEISLLKLMWQVAMHLNVRRIPYQLCYAICLPCWKV